MQWINNTVTPILFVSTANLVLARLEVGEEKNREQVLNEACADTTDFFVFSTKDAREERPHVQHPLQMAHLGDAY